MLLTVLMAEEAKIFIETLLEDVTSVQEIRKKNLPK